MRRAQRARHDGFIAACCFHHDQRRGERPQPLDEARQSFAVALDGEAFAAGTQMYVKPILRHIDTDKVLHVPSLHMRARPAALATVRATGTGGWGTVLRSGLIDLGGLGLPSATATPTL